MPMTCPPPLIPPTDEAIRDILRRVVDPEVGVNIVDLGLIYRIATDATPLLIEMTMTSPACPMGDMIIDDMRDELARALPEGAPPEIRLVWEPPWHPALMSPRSRAHFGWAESDSPAAGDGSP